VAAAYPNDVCEDLKTGGVTVRTFFQLHSRRLLAIAIVTVVYYQAKLPTISRGEQAVLAQRFRFSQLPLPGPPSSANRPQRNVRAVHPELARISAWISAVGAAVALNDLDGDGLPNDVCYVDPRTDQVVVAPAPGTSKRYEPFVLDPSPLPYDEATMAPMGCLPGDMNEDGLTDILVYYWGRTPIGFMRRGGPSRGLRTTLTRESYTAVEIVDHQERWYSNAAAFADLDGDGHLDLIVGNYFPDGARILDGNATNHEQMQHSMSRAENGGGVRFLLWSDARVGEKPSVQFEEVKDVLESQIRHGWTLAVGAADLDGDLLPEVYIANDFGPDHLLHNRSKPGQLKFVPLYGQRTFTTPKSEVIGQDSFKGMGVDFGDLNGDGILDICVSNITLNYALEESNFVFLSTGHPELMRRGIAPYVDHSESWGLARAGWSWDIRLGDFDNSGTLEVLQATGFIKGITYRWPELQELAMGNDELLSSPYSWPRLQVGDDLSGGSHNPFFVRARDGRYYDVAHEIGLDQQMVSRGIATADVDGDGRLDFAVANQWETSYFFHNESPHVGAFLGLHLLLPLRPGEIETTRVRAGHPSADTVGRPAIGAFATVRLLNGQKLIQEVDGGNGHSGKRSPDLHFGLGDFPPDTKVDVEVRWRDPEGIARQEHLALGIGWNTVLLAWPGERAGKP
jgi:enediyne biosynthesis protein E4